MKILAIAYACEPNRGSEPGVGWNWVKLISAISNCELSVITRANNQRVIDEYLSKHNDINAGFIYYDLPKKILKYKHGDKGIKIFFTLWQRGVIKHIKKNIDLNQYDLIWDFNFGSLNAFLFTYKLNKRYIIGPVSTKKKVPKLYIKKMGFIQKLKYKLQSFMKEHLWSNPIVWKALKRADSILLCNELSREFLPKSQRAKAKVVFHNGIVAEDYPKYEGYKKDNKMKLIYAGRLIDSKNIETAIEALKIVHDCGKNFVFDIYGNGPLKHKLKNMVIEYGLEEKIVFHKKVTQQELFREYINKDIFLFPSLLEISSTAVMEAMYCGLLPICLDIRCMEFIFSESPIIRVPCISPEEDAEGLAQAIMNIDLDQLKDVKNTCFHFAAERFTWDKKVKEAERLVREIL